MATDFIHQLNKDTELSNQSNRLKRLNLDPVAFFLIVLLCILSLFILYSSSHCNTHLIVRQAIHMGIGFFMILILAHISPKKIQHMIFFYYLLGVALLIFVLISGSGAKGAMRWLNCFGFRFQPSEFMKFIMPITIAAYITRYPLPCNYKQIFVALILMAIPVLLIAKQPDLGTAILVFLSGLIVIFLSGLKISYIVLVASLAAPGFWIVWHFFLHTYQKNRVLTFLNPDRDPLGAGWHIIQSKIAIGSGGILGKGYLNGSQSYLNFLPEGQTDFIFSVLAEEFGLLGVFILFIIYIALIIRCLYIALHASSSFENLVASSIALLFSMYAFINIGMVVGLLPVVGVPLPLVSRGGTALISTLAGFGLIMSIQAHKRLLQ
ncbi:MAG: rod shape-determining protein RodA [Endozoicomonadaceae bacterium]|nr:rod shape-determining protein RodA [Endozoicomonadaceae bacterium]MBE8233675.1 rod shape-determining protein RodA [Endozoicomonadaceae bacterium]